MRTCDYEDIERKIEIAFENILDYIEFRRLDSEVEESIKDDVMCEKERLMDNIRFMVNDD